MANTKEIQKRMKSIRDTVEQYNGMFQCKSQEDRFEVVITIYG